MKLQTKISLYMVGILTAIGLLVAAIVGSLSGNLAAASAKEQLKERAVQLIELVDAFRMQCETQATYEMTAFGNGQRGEWRRNDGELVETAGVSLPTLSVGGRSINNNFAIVDDFTRTYGSVATIFVRHKDDFYRITTSLKKADGTRAVGTSLGSAHPAYAALSRGEAYVGKANLFGRDYVTKYVPVKNDRNEVVGALFVGADFSESFAALKASIRSFKIAGTGYAFAIDVGNSKSAGELVIHPSLEGKDAYDLKDAATGAAFLKQVGAADEGVVEYMWNDAARGLVKKYSIFKTYQPWKMQFHISVYEDDFLAVAHRSAFWVAAAMVLSSMLMAAIAVAAVKRLVLMPLGGEPDGVVRLAASVAGGDLTQSITAPSGTLLGSLAEMQRSLAQTISGVMNNAGEIAARSRGLSDSTRNIEANARNQAEATAASAANIEELTVSIGEVSRIAAVTEQNSRKVSDLSERGVRLVQSTASQIAAVQASVQSSSSQIRVLLDKTSQIGSVANVIRDIADQTNLLALNAAIEAARAGEQGRGFAVVADEVRKLAERTSAATSDIAQMIGAVQTENNRAVDDMEKVAPLVDQCIAATDEAAAALQEIHHEAAQSLVQVSDVSNATQEQASAANAIAQNMERIAGMSEENNASIEEAAVATGNLDRIAEALRDQMAKFKV